MAMKILKQIFSKMAWDKKIVFLLLGCTLFHLQERPRNQVLFAAFYAEETCK